jgi:hypothetical protein
MLYWQRCVKVKALLGDAKKKFESRKDEPSDKHLSNLALVSNKGLLSVVWALKRNWFEGCQVCRVNT